MNVLFVGGGRRVELAWRFIDKDYCVYSYELDRKAPIASVARIIEGLRWDDPLVLQDLATVIIGNDIRLVLPLMDAAIPICARLPELIGTLVLTPSPIVADICYDKHQYQQFMMGNFPTLYPSAMGEDFPWIAKPRFGFGSKHIITIKNVYDWDEFTSIYNSKDFVFQKKLEGDEYSVDAYFDKNGKYVDGIPRLRLRVGSGEVITSKTVNNSNLQSATQLIGEALGLVGPINMQFMKERDSSVFHNFEVNCRFGGGWTFTIEAGLDAIALIDNEYFGVEYNYVPRKWKKNFLLERSYRDHYYKNSN